ncbi:MAG: cytosine permease [Planctomycetes bacterium]|nr:cytosine permease [Planctomycetota bacterium]
MAIGLVLLGWGIAKGGGLANVLGKSEQFSRASVTARVEGGRATVEVGSFDDRATRVRLATIEKGSKTPKGLATEWRPTGEEPHETLVPEGHVIVAQLGDAEGHVSSVLIAKEASGGVSFWFFVANLTAMVGFWATLSLNIPDFTRYARSQKDQMLGQIVGLPTTMALYSFIGVAVTCAAVVVFPDILVVEDAPWDPVRLIADRFADSKLVTFVAMVAIAIATLTTNIAANVVSPANDFSNLAPNRVSFRTGGLITAVIGVAMMPWKLLATAGAYIFTWLIGYGALLGPIGGIMIADYYVVRRTRLAVEDLYRADGAYAYRGGFNLRALAVLAVAILPNVPGFLVEGGFVAADVVPEFFRYLYKLAWFAGFAIAFVLYLLVAKKPGKGEN